MFGIVGAYLLSLRADAEKEFARHNEAIEYFKENYIGSRLTDARSAEDVDHKSNLDKMSAFYMNKFDSACDVLRWSIDRRVGDIPVDDLAKLSVFDGMTVSKHLVEALSREFNMDNPWVYSKLSEIAARNGAADVVPDASIDAVYQQVETLRNTLHDAVTVATGEDQSAPVQVAKERLFHIEDYGDLFKSKHPALPLNTWEGQFFDQIKALAGDREGQKTFVIEKGFADCIPIGDPRFAEIRERIHWLVD